MPSAAELIAEGRKARAEHHLNEARLLYAEAAQTYQREQDQLAYAHTVRHIADMFLHESKYAEAKPLYEEALEIYRGSLDTKLLDLANTVRPYALLHEGLKDAEAASRLWLEARNLYASLRIEPGVTECEKHLAELQRF